MGRQKDIDMGGGVFARPGRRRKHLKPYETLYESNHRDVAATLRKIASQVEAGNFGDVDEVALIFDCADGKYVTFGFGPKMINAYSSLALFEIGTEEVKWLIYQTREAAAEPPNEAG